MANIWLSCFPWGTDVEKMRKMSISDKLGKARQREEKTLQTDRHKMGAVQKHVRSHGTPWGTIEEAWKSGRAVQQ